jgi:ZIP family zinc transporter
MDTKLSLLVIVLVIAELTGAFIFYKTKDAVKRTLLSCLGLGFALAIVLMDVLPDATEDFSIGFIIFGLGIIVMFGITKFAKKAGGYTSVVGMGFHNFCEGVVLKTLCSTMSPLLLVGAVLHKLPEGMATFALLDGVKDKTRFILSSMVGLLIPIGAFVVIPEEIDQPIMSFVAGVILFTVSKAIFMVVSNEFKSRNNESASLSIPKMASVLVTGMVVGGISCLLV